MLNKSLKYFQKCDEIQPNTANILFNLALIFQSTGKINDAKKNLQQIDQISKTMEKKPDDKINLENDMPKNKLN